MVIGTYLSIITINMNGLNAPTKRHRLAEWIQKQDPYICCLQETHFRPRDTYRLKVRGWKKMFHANQNHSEVSPHTSKNGHHQNIYKKQMLERVWRKGNPLVLLEGM